MMNTLSSLEATIHQHLAVLVDEIGARPTGSVGNHRAGAYLKQQFGKAGWQVESPLFNCLTWETGGSRLSCGEQRFEVQANPYSPTFEGSFPFVVCDTVEALEQFDTLRGHLLVLSGLLAAESYMPLKFPFVTIEEQQRVLGQILHAQPEAVIGINSQPLFCDGDFPIPSVTLAPADGSRLLACSPQPLRLSIQGRRIESNGHNVIAHPVNLSLPKIVICAHYDTWFDTPGAVDNATGVTVLLALAQLLSPQKSNIEFVVFNGEDHYASPGEVSYLERGMGDIACAINIDGVGAQAHQNSVAYFGESPILERIQSVQQQFPAIVTSVPWYQSDHTLFVQQGIPAIALTSSPFDLKQTHTPHDTLDKIDTAAVAEAVRFIYQIVVEDPA
jgi:aminopeptidase YwaD